MTFPCRAVPQAADRWRPGLMPPWVMGSALHIALQGTAGLRATHFMAGHAACFKGVDACAGPPASGCRAVWGCPWRARRTALMAKISLAMEARPMKDSSLPRSPDP